MADTAFQTMYRDETIMGFEKRESLVRKTTVTETQIKGNQAIFLVADSGGATAVTRGINGKIPSRPDNNNQYTVQLAEWHDKPIKTGFNIFSSQGNQRDIMQRTAQSVINRKIDDDIHGGLNAATVTWGTAAAATLTLVTKAKTKLGNAFALDDAPVFGLITPAFHGYLMGIKEFASSDYINLKPFEGVSKSRAFEWFGVNWIVDAGLPGTGSASATCFMYSQNAIGHAADTANMQTYVDYDKEDDYSYARCSIYMGTKLLQNAGVVKMPHNDSALS
jgi:hypothetical protein